MGDVVIRPAGADDVDELVRLRGLMLTAVWGDHEGDGADVWADRCREVLAAALRDERACAFVGDVGERLVASGIGLLHDQLPSPHNPSGRHGYLLSMVTEPEWRGRGIATEIVQATLDWFQARDVVRVSLHATEAGEPIYRSLGFRAPTYTALSWKPGPAA